jgi:hypothetical protein
MAAPLSISRASCSSLHVARSSKLHTGMSPQELRCNNWSISLEGLAVESVARRGNGQILQGPLLVTELAPLL